MKWPFNPCRRHRQSLGLLASRVLPEREQAEVERHLATCAACSKYYRELKAVTQPLANWAANFANLQPDQAMQARWARAVRQPTRPVSVREWLHDVLWPYRRIWAGLAAVWVLIFLGNASLRDHPQIFAEKPSPPAQEMLMAFKDRQSILAELLADRAAPPEAGRQRVFPPRPRTERVETLIA